MITNKLHSPDCYSSQIGGMVVTLKQLEAFYWAASCSNFAVAAQRLHLSVSSLSKRIAELEAYLGQLLFDRSGHRAVLTEAGKFLMPRARELLMAAEKLQTELRHAANLEGYCQIGVGELTALTWLPSLLRQVRNRHPKLSLEAFVGIGEILEQRLADGEIDVAIVAGRSSLRSVSSEPIGEARFAWYIAQSVHPEFSTIEARLFQQLPMVGLPSGSGVTRLVDDWQRDQGLMVGERIVCNQWGAVVGLLREGLGFGLLPRGWADAFSVQYGLRRLGCEPELPALDYYVHWRSDDYRTLVKTLRELVLRSVCFNI